MTATQSGAAPGTPEGRSGRRGPRRRRSPARTSTSSTTSTWCSGPARSSAWSASPAPARPRSAPSLLGYSRARRVHLARQGAARGPRRARHAVAGGPRDPRRGDRLRPAGPGVRAQPGHPDRQADRRAAGAARHRHRRVAPAGRARRPGRGRPAQRRRVPAAATPTSSPAARCSASRWPWRSCPSPRCWCSTSRRPASTSPPRAWCSRPWPSCAAPTGSAALYVTHDLAVVANIADRVAVMYAGQIVELGPQGRDVREPRAPLHAGAARLDPAPEPGARAHRHPRPHARRRAPARPAAASTTAARSSIDALQASRCPSCATGRARTTTCAASAPSEIGTWDISRGTVPDADPDKPRDVILSVEDLNVFYGRKQVVHDVSFDLAKAEVVALVGESGSGKTTISRCVGGLHKDWTGDDHLRGRRAGQECPPAQRRRTASGSSTSSRTPTSR